MGEILRRIYANSTGCPIADTVEAGLWLDPKIGCGPAHLDRGRIVYDPLQPIDSMLRELAEQAAIYRETRGLRIVRPDEVQNAYAPVGPDDRGSMLDDASGTGVRQRLRHRADTTDPADRVSSDAPNMRVRLRRKLPLGV